MEIWVVKEESSSLYLEKEQLPLMAKLVEFKLKSCCAFFAKVSHTTVTKITAQLFQSKILSIFYMNKFGMLWNVSKGGFLYQNTVELYRKISM